MMTSETPFFSKKGVIPLLLAIILVCFNLRPAMTAADPLLGDMEHDLGLSLDGSGAFALLPVFVLGIAAPIVPWLARRMVPWKIILFFQMLGIVGILWRSFDGSIGLFGGMILLGLGMGVAGAAVPGFIKHEFPGHAPAMMGLYSALIGLGSSVAAACTVPIAHVLGGWRGGLAFWALPIVVGLVVWGWNFLSHPAETTPKPLDTKMSRLLRNGRAWQITLFYVCRVAAAYFFFTWVAVLLQRRGMRPEDAGFIMAVSTVAQIPASLSAHWFAEKMGDRGALIAIAISLSCFGCWGMFYGPLEWVLPLAIVLGLGTGTVFSRGMALMVERAQDQTKAIELSSMAQGFGFTIGALIALGASSLLPAEGGFALFCLIYTLISAGGIFFGYLSSKPGYV